MASKQGSEQRLYKSNNYNNNNNNNIMKKKKMMINNNNNKNNKNSSYNNNNNNINNNNNNNINNINKYIEYNDKTQLLYSRQPIKKGTRILVECPLIMLPTPPIRNHPGNNLYAYNKFKTLLSREKQEWLLERFDRLKIFLGGVGGSSSSSSSYSSYSFQSQKPILKIQSSIESALAFLQKEFLSNSSLSSSPSSSSSSSSITTPITTTTTSSQIKNSENSQSNNNNNNNTINNKPDWKEMSRLLHILHYYGIILPYVSPLEWEMNSIEKFQLQWNGSKSLKPLPTKNDEIKRGENDDDSRNYRTIIGQGIFEYSSHLAHSCVPTCQVNVIDEKGTIELRMLCDIPKKGIVLSRNYLENLDNENWTHRPGSGNNGNSATSSTEVMNSNVCGDLNLISCRDRCEYLLRHYHLLCQCPRCQDWDRLRGFRCSCVVNSNNCQGILWSKPPYLVWQCQQCERYIEKEALQLALEQESKILHKMRGIDTLMNFRLFSQTVRENLYILLNEASLILARNHWIIIYLLWLCFEEKFNNQVSSEPEAHELIAPTCPLTMNERLQQSWIYLRRHVELCQSVYNYPNEYLIGKLELLSDLLPNPEIYKYAVLEQLVEYYTLAHGELHSSTKRAISKLRVYQRWLKTNETKKSSEKE